MLRRRKFQFFIRFSTLTYKTQWGNVVRIDLPNGSVFKGVGHERRFDDLSRTASPGWVAFLLRPSHHDFELKPLNAQEIYSCGPGPICPVETVILKIEEEKDQAGNWLITRPVEHAGTRLQKIVAGSLGRAQAGEGPALTWPLACVNAVTRRTRALDFERGILRVEAPDAGWRAELRSLASRHLAVMHRYTSESVERIDFVISASGNAGGGGRVRPV